MAAPTIARPTDDLSPEERADESPPEESTDAALGSGQESGAGDASAEPAQAIAWRPLFAATLVAAGAGLVTGGIFGSWAARLLGLVAAVGGAGWAVLALRNPKRETAYQLALVPAALAVAMLLMVPAGGSGPGALPQAVRDAIESGRLLRPPVPFDSGWIPILTVVFALLGFGAGWVSTALGRARLGMAVPLPVLALTALTQPEDGQFIAGLCAFLPLLAALAVVFGGDDVRASELTKEFELKRALRGVAAAATAIVALVVLSNASFLFPEPVYDPTDQPQKPRPIPLSQIRDRVLFEVTTEAPITGPWKTGVLDVYDGEAWRLPPFDKERFVDVPPDGVVNENLATSSSVTVTFTIRELGNATSLPGTTTPGIVEIDPSHGARFDPRADVLRMPAGRVPPDISYAVSLPPYPNADVLGLAPARQGDFTDTLDIPEPPGAIRDVLASAPVEPAWARLDFVRKRLRSVAVAAGGGKPDDISPARVAEIIEGPNHEASPYEIVAAEAMLARWAGIPSRIGFGFDGVNDEGGVKTVRPANAAQWLEVYFEGHGWVPLIEAPEQAKQTLDNDPNAQFDPDTVASDEVAVELYIPVKLQSLQLLYERLRELLALALPYVLVGVALYLANPAVMRFWRRRKRRRWAEQAGPHAQVAVEYAEFRDQAHDLNVGDPLDTPLEYLKRVTHDAEHQEFAWLVSRVLYGDMARAVGPQDVVAAEELGASLRRRMFRGQPFQVRVIAVVSKASLRQPFTDEVPNVRLLDPLGRFGTWHRARKAARAGRPRRMPGWLRLPSTHIPQLTGRRP